MQSEHEANNGVDLEKFDLLDIVASLRPLYILLPILRDIRKLTYENAISYFVENQPPVPVAKGVMILEPDEHSPYMYFTQLFLDDDDNVVSTHDGSPYGRRLLLRKLDSELSAVFGSKRIVIVE